MGKNFIEVMEQQELIQKLIDNGHGRLVDALLSSEGQVYTKKGRLNKCGTCRTLDMKSKELEDALAACREILRDEMGTDDE